MNEPQRASTRVTRIIAASAEALYAAFMDPDALVEWLPPGEMTGKVHAFDPSVGGGYEMSLYYPATDRAHRGKTTAHEDQVHVRFTELVPGKKIVEAVTFVSTDPALAGEMTMTITFEPTRGAGVATNVTILSEHLPPGLRPEDNAEGSRLSLQQLARWVVRR
jgi:uncharacterized protein YndB with AHSA1/START domain